MWLDGNLALPCKPVKKDDGGVLHQPVRKAPTIYEPSITPRPFANITRLAKVIYKMDPSPTDLFRVPVMKRHLIASLFFLVGGATLGIGCTSGPPDVPETPEAEFTPLFNGNDLDGWEVVGGEAAYRVQDDSIIGVCKKTKKNTFLRTQKTYRDFEFRAQFKWDTPGNSGIQFRSHQYPSTDEDNPSRVYGYQFELDSSARAWSGGLYEEGRRGWIVDLGKPEDSEDNNVERRNAVKLDDWNEIVIQCKANRIRTWLNGVSIVDHIDADGEFPLLEGFFALQVHAGGSGQFQWRNLRIKEFEPEE